MWHYAERPGTGPLILYTHDRDQACDSSLPGDEDQVGVLNGIAARIKPMAPGTRSLNVSSFACAPGHGDQMGARFGVTLQGAAMRGAQQNSVIFTHWADHQACGVLH